MRFLILALGLFILVMLLGYSLTRTWTVPGMPENRMTVQCEQRLITIGKAVAAANTCEVDADCAVYGETCVPVTTCNTVIRSAAVQSLQEIFNEYEQACGGAGCKPCAEGNFKAVCDDGKCFLEAGF